MQERLPEPEIEYALPEYVTILECAKARGVTANEDGSITGGEFERVGFAIIGGCGICQATIAAYNAYPTTTGYWRCEDCVDDTGFATVEDFEAFEVWADEIDPDERNTEPFDALED